MNNPTIWYREIKATGERLERMSKVLAKVAVEAKKAQEKENDGR